MMKVLLSSEMKTADNSKMDQDFFEYLPSEIVVNILSRLPTRAAAVCKCVCKPWLGLLATPEFVNSHISRPVPGIVVETRSRSYDVIEFVDELGLHFDDEHRAIVAFNFELPFDVPMHSSANGLIFLSGVDRDDLIQCNPITRDYIKLPSPRQTTSKDQLAVENFGFGVSKMTGQYKVVRLFGEKPLHEEYRIECQVYNVGTGSWRKVPSGSIDSSLKLYKDVRGVLLDGNLHWMVDKTTNFSCRWVLRFDLQTELFSVFSAPPPIGINFLFGRSLCFFRDCLGLSDFSDDRSILIWFLVEDKGIWDKDFIREFGRRDHYNYVWPIRAFENGDVFMESDFGNLLYYSNKSKTFDYNVVVREDRDTYTPTTMYASSFLSLKSFVMENVSSF